jgi:hypothetical protein
VDDDGETKMAGDDGDRRKRKFWIKERVAACGNVCRPSLCPRVDFLFSRLCPRVDFLFSYLCPGVDFLFSRHT